MTWFEWILLAWLGIAILIGWRAGFIFTAGNLVGFLVSLWVSKHYGGVVAEWAGGGAWGSVLASLGVVLVVTKLGGLIALVVDKFAKISYIIPFVKTFNRLLGAGLSFATHGMVAALIAFMVNSIILEKLITQPWAKVLVSAGSLLAGALPSTVQKFLL